MNMEITLAEHQRLCGSDYKEFKFGSRLFGTNHENSDYDYLRMYKWDSIFDESDQTYLPNLHSFKYADIDSNTEYIWTTERQFYSNLFLADGTIYSDIVIFSGNWDSESILSMCRTFKIIKSYCGVAKRDLRNNDPKKLKLAHRSLVIAQKLLENILPELSNIQDISYDLNKDSLMGWEARIRIEAIKLYDSKTLNNYPIYNSTDSLLHKMYAGNNIRQFIF